MRIPLLFVFLAGFCCSFDPLLAQGGGCECTNCPQFMQDLFVGDFNLNVQGASNPILGQNGQGVCGVIVHWDHTAICDITITLTSPSGQTVTLVGPIGQFCTNMGNTGTDWNVTFLPCGSGAVPDPGFTAQWNSDQNWGANNNYSGSYYPFNGCLQNFTGPVNGNWVLTVTDGQAADTGNLFDYEIIFCDPSGINCVSCEADAGTLLQSDVMECEGSADLALDLPPTYNPPAVEPPVADYSYTYVIGGAGGVIQSYIATPDMSTFAAGNYSICGLSYLTAHQNLIPPPNGVLTVNQLTTQLNSNAPTFCGSITPNCVNVTIFPIPPDQEQDAVICAPACFDFLGQFYCQTGDYIEDQMDANGCHYNAILHLTVNVPTFHTITETVCPGECSTHPSFPGACGTGQYQVTLTNAADCDSILTLNLTTMNINAVIQPPMMITCTQTTVPLSGIGSTLGSGTTYLWTASNGGTISGANNLISATAGTPGTYQLLVCRTLGGVSCCDSASVNVTSSITLPNTPVISGSNTICLGDTQVYTILPVNGATGYTWTVPAGINILSGQGTTSISVEWVNVAGGDICVTANNACGPSPAACMTISVLNTPPVPVVNGNIVACKDSIENYAVSPIPGVSTFNWQVTGGSIQSGNGTNNVQVVWNGGVTTGTVCATATNNCGLSAPACISVTIDAVPPLPVIIGDSTRCIGTNGNYSITPLSSATGYIWTVPAGASIVSGQNSTAIVVSWTSTPGGNVCVSATNGCGVGLQQCIPVTVFAQPVANAGLDAAICGATIQLGATQSVAGSAGAWSAISGPGIATFVNSNLATTSVSVDNNGIYQFQWTEANGICTDQDTVQIAFNASPMTGISQPACDGTNQNYTITFPVSGGTVPYTIPGGSILNGIFTSTPIPNGQSYVFVVTDSNGCVAPPISGVFNCNCATNAGQMNLQMLTACPGNSVAAQAALGSNLDADDIGAFILHSNAGSVLGTIYGENTSGIFNFSAGMTFGTTYFISYVVGNNLNGLPDLTDPCLSVAPGQPVTFFDNPVPNAGLDVAVCALTLTVNGNNIAGSSVWSVISAPPGGIATIANAQSASTGVTATIFGDYTLTYTITNNGCMASDTVDLHFGDSPVAGAVSHVCDGTNLTFTVTFGVSGGIAPYSVNGQSVAGATFTSAPLANGASYSYVITDADGCVSGNVNGVFSCNCATSAGQVSLTPITACQSDSITIQLLGGQNLDADDVASFVLHTGSGTTLGTILSENHTGKFGYWATMSFGTTYYVSAVAGNNLNGFPDPSDLCFSVSQGQPIVFIQNPVPDAGGDFVVCGLTASMDATTGLFPGAWTQISGPGTVNFADNTDPESQVVAAVSGTYMFQWAESNGLCAADDMVQVQFLDNPVVSSIAEVCNGTNTGYTLSFTVNNGVGPYTITGLNGSFSGNTYTSELLPNNSNYSFLLQDQFGCQSPVFMGNFLCNCSTNAGTMNTTPLVFCADQPAVAPWNNDATMDADDAVAFILHDQAGGSLGNVFDVNNQPIFTFGPTLQTGTTYYISAIAGNDLSGTIDVNDPCLDVSPGTPIQWKALPFAALNGDATICNGSSTVLNINGTGTFPLQLTYDNGTGIPVQMTIPNPQTIPISVSPASTTTYTLLSVTDGSLPNCTATLNDDVTVIVNQPVDAGIANTPVELCAGASQIIPLGTLITGEDAGGIWSETSNIPSSSGAFSPTTGSFNTNGQQEGDYSFQYTLQAALPCPSQFTSVGVTIHPTPVADAGMDQMIDCHQEMVTLGGAGTTVGAGITHSWSVAGTPVGNGSQLISDQGGDFTLTVTNPFGCSDTDIATVVINDDIPFAGRVFVTPVQCFGDGNGAIVLDSIVSGHPPVLFSINGGPFVSSPVFSPLSSDTYTVTLMDSNGCEWSTDALFVAEPPLMTVNLGGEITAIFGDSVLLMANTMVPITALESITWTPLFDTIHANTFQQEFLPLVSTYANITIVDSNGCSASNRVLVRVERPEQVYIPNVFKPGSSGFNDRLTVYGGHGVELIESFKIFDRWGEQLFESLNFEPNEPTKGWDGSYRGDPVLPGVYVCFAVVRFIDGEVKVYKGDVTVVR